MERLSAMKNLEIGTVCWIASFAKEYYSQMGIESGTIIRRLNGYGDYVLFACGGRRFIVDDIADGLGVVPVECS